MYDYVDMIETTPTPSSKKCKIISFILMLFLKFNTVFTSIIIWYLYDYFIAGLSLVLSFIIMGIIRSKIINNFIPPTQREYTYNDKELANWYTVNELCIEYKS